MENTHASKPPAEVQAGLQQALRDAEAAERAKRRAELKRFRRDMAALRAREKQQKKKD